jgi:RimJ/RimL family protein N-acetyltransferase
MTAPPIIETDRLLLRRFVEEDVEAFYLLGTVPAVVRYTGDPGLKDLAHAREVLLTRPIADYHKYGYGRLACVLKETGTVIGFAGLKYLDDRKVTDLGYRLLPEFWGRGLATEACRPLVPYGFEVLRLDRITGLVDPENTASIRVLTKIGLTLLGEVEYAGKKILEYEIRSPLARGGSPCSPP